MLRIWAGNVQFDGTPLPCISCTRLDVCCFYLSRLFFLESQQALVSPSQQACLTPTWLISTPPWAQGPSARCEWRTPISDSKAAFLHQDDIVSSVSEQESSHTKTVTQLPFPTRASQAPWSPFARCGLSSQAGRCECTQLYAVWGTLLFCFFVIWFVFFNKICFLLQSKAKAGLGMLKKMEHSSGKLTQKRSGEFSITAHSVQWQKISHAIHPEQPSAHHQGREKYYLF